MNYDPFNYYGFDYLTSLLAIFGIFFLGNRNRIGFLLNLTAICSGIIFAYLAKSYPFIFMNIIMFVMNFRGFMKWKKGLDSK